MIWLVFTVLLWGLLHSLLASLRIKTWARHVLSARIFRYYRLAYNLFACISFLPIIVVAALIPDHRLYFIPIPWSAPFLMGELLAVAALVIGFRQNDIWEFLGLRAIGEHPKPDKLTITGLYRFVRHPLYTAGLVFIWLIPLMTVNLLVINLSLTVYVITGAYFEERKLTKKYGQSYLDYKMVTPMFIPFLKWDKSPDKPS